MAEQAVLVEVEAPIATVRMNRLDSLNALSEELIGGVVAALVGLDENDAVRCIVLAGGDRAFAAGADIEEMSDQTAIDMALGGRVEQWDRLAGLHTPLVAAVSGFCLGGGCELAMACDLIVASETARFGQPETGVGLIPGAGGTQRLTRAVGKALTMDMVLTGRMLSAEEAMSAGLVARVVSREAWLTEARRVAGEIAARAPIAQRLAKESVDRAFETGLRSGLEFERKALHLSFASEDAHEGLTAFVEKRRPQWQSR
ncbi:MAG: enoyl-CoA hydratase [Solirubrobacterales bacterium 70-9]|nr:MAG: enoyl-CoA hydratase [Solirubrobacterales bacterium 70-9]